MTRFVLLLAFCFPIAVSAQTSLETQARDALMLMENAAEQLGEVDGARDRVKALTKAISAHEDGLAALRVGMRQVSAREAALSADLIERESEIAALLSVLHRLDIAKTPVALAHPGGPTGSVRAGMLLVEIVPALNVRAEELRDDFAEVETLRDLQESAIQQLEAGVARLQTAREALNSAIADRTPLPKRFVNDPVREAILVASSDTMAQFADGLSRIAVDQVAEAPADLEQRQGSLSLPVAGDVTLLSGQADAANVARPGIVMSTQPQAIVTTPVASTIRYTGPLLDYGQVVILEPMRDLLFVFAGLETVYVSAGDVIESGAPLGLMGRIEDKNAAQQSTDGEVTGARPSETLYIEVRQNNTPEDPSLWFRMDKDG